MKGWITLTHFHSGNKIHLQVANIVAFREMEKAVLVLSHPTQGMYVSETMEEIAFLMGVA